MAGCPCLSLHKLSRKVSKFHEKIFYYCGNDRRYLRWLKIISYQFYLIKEREKKIGKCESFETAAHEIETEIFTIFTSTLKPRPKSLFHNSSIKLLLFTITKRVSGGSARGYSSCFVSSQSTIILADSEQEQVFITFPWFALLCLSFPVDVSYFLLFSSINRCSFTFFLSFFLRLNFVNSVQILNEN